MSDLYVKRYPELDPELRKYIRENRKKWDAQKQLHIRNTEKEIMGEVEKVLKKLFVNGDSYIRYIIQNIY